MSVKFAKACRAHKVELQTADQSTPSRPGFDSGTETSEWLLSVLGQNIQIYQLYLKVKVWVLVRIQVLVRGRGVSVLASLPQPKSTLIYFTERN